MTGIDSTAPGLSGPPEGFDLWWRRLPRSGRLVLTLVVLAIVVQTVSTFAGGALGGGPQPIGVGSSFDAGHAGTGAFAQLLTDRHFAVRQLTESLAGAPVAPAATVVSLDSSQWNQRQTDAIVQLLRRSDNVVVSGRVPTTDLLRFYGLDGAFHWRSTPVGRAAAVGSNPLVAGVTTLTSRGPGSFSVNGSTSSRATVIARNGSSDLALVVRDQGTLVLLASSSPLWDGYLAQSDDAAFALNLATGRGRVVVFDEYGHGYGHGGSGLAGLPGPWRVGLLVLLGAVAIWIVSAAQRLGPPQLAERELIPARIGYVDAMAAQLGTRDLAQLSDAIDPVSRTLRATLARRLGVSDRELEPEFVAAVAELPPRATDYAYLVGVATTPPTTTQDIVAVGRAFARLQSPSTIKENL